MRTQYIFIYIILGIFSFSSCSDSVFNSESFLDKDPLVESSAGTYYSNESEANSALVGIYSILQNEQTQLAPFMIIGDDASDNYTIGNSNSEAYAWLGGPAEQIQKFDVTSTNWVSNQLWSQGFEGITWATESIERIKGNDNIPQEKREQFIGEAHFLRAMYYFLLTRQYGRLPIIDHTLSYEEYFTSRATIEETWAFIEADLDTAATLLPLKSEYSSENLGRATKGAAKTLLGKSHIYQSEFEEAYQVLEEVVTSNEYSLEPNYADIFTIENENGMESIFEIQHSTTGTGWSNDNEGSILSFYEHDADPDNNVTWQNGWSMHCPTQNLVDSYEEGDPRLDATVIFPGETWDGHVHENVGSPTGYQSKKWYVPYDLRSQIDQSDNPKNIIFMRYASVLLYLAEAANEIGRTGEALMYLEEVRSRARSNASESGVLPEVTESNKQDLREIIWHERRVEFAGEGQRFWELARQDRAGEVMRAYSQEYNSIKGQSFVDGVNNIFPIPQNEIDLSDGTMEQNPGY